MKRFRDEEILGRFVPAGPSPPGALAERASCDRAHCAGGAAVRAAQAYRWRPRYGGGPAILLCPPCHGELATMATGG